MITRYLIPLLSFAGLIFAIIFVFGIGKKESLPPNQLSEPPSAPYAATISGTGIIEANSRNIDIGSFLSGIISAVMINEGELVKKGDVLFSLDDRAAASDLQMRKKDLVAAEARLETMRVQLADDQDQLKRSESMKVGIAVSQDMLQRRRFTAKKSTASLNQAQAELESAKAQLESSQVMLDKMTVRAPIDGRVLKVRTRPGEYVTAGSAPAPVLMGNDTPLYVRVTIDENDVWRFSKEAKAEAALRSNKDIKVPLSYVRIEPYVQPKKNLSGNSAELVDTRVLEVVYEIATSNEQLFIGQQMDVFIEEVAK